MRSLVDSLSYRPPAPAVPGDAGAEPCVTCGAAAGTPYCARCGEQRAADRPRTLRALAEEAWDALSPVDGRVARTLWTLVARPGELTASYMRGRRLPFVPPVRLFLLVNVLFFVHASLIGNHTFDTPLRTHLQATAHEAVARRMMMRRFPRAAGETLPAYHARLNREVNAYAPRFDARSATQAKSLVIAMVPLFAALVAVVQLRRRRPALEHLAFSLHAMATMMLLVIGAVYVIGYPMQAAFRWLGAADAWQPQDLIISAMIVGALAWWLVAGLRRAYGEGRAAAAVKGIALALGFGLVLFAYRALLFFTTLWTT